MTDLVEVHVHSNIEALSALRLHEALKSMVKDTARDSMGFLRANRAEHTRSGGLEEHLHEDRVEEVAGLIQSKLGVSEVEEANERPTFGLFRRSRYPLFVESGTRAEIFSPRGTAMWNRPEGIFNRMSVRGQPPQHFMLKTYEEARALIRSDHQIADALREMNAEAVAMAAAMRTE